MKKIVAIILLLISIISLLASCNANTDTIDDALSENTNEKRDHSINKMDEAYLQSLPEVFKQIHEKNTLTIAMYSEDRYPYFFLNGDGKLVGSDVDMAYDIARQLGIKHVEFDRSAKTYDEMIDLVVEKKVDLALSKISVTSHRAQRVLFSEPYIKLKQAVLMNRMQLSQLKSSQGSDSDPIELLSKDEVEIGVVVGTSYVEFARENFQAATVVAYETKEDLFAAVQQGEILAAFYDEFEFKRYVTENPDVSLDLQLAVLDGRNDFLAIAIPAEHIHMQAWLKHYLDYREPMDIDEILQMYRDQLPNTNE